MFKFLTGFLVLAAVAQAASLKADSPQGQRLLKQAKAVHRQAKQNENGYYPYLSSMTIKYVGCSTYSQYAGNRDNQNYQDQQQGNGNGYNKWQQYEGQPNDNYWKYQQMASNDGLETSNLVRFTLCPAENCGGNCQGEYVIDMETFIKEYLDWKMEHEKFWCERVRENCICNNNYSWQQCYASCFEQFGLSYDSCISNGNGNNGNSKNGNGANVFEIQQYLECSGIKFYNPDYMYQNGYYGGYSGNNGNVNGYNYYGGQAQNNFNWNNFYFLGLTCSNNKNVILQAFYDEDCSYPADESEVQSAMGDYNNIPYLKGTAILDQGTCIPCKDDEDAVNQKYQQNQNQYQQNQNYYYNTYGEAQQYWEEGWQDQPDATELCEMVTSSEYAIVCDQYNQAGCDWIHTTLPSMDGRFSFDYASKIAALKEELNKSQRVRWGLFALVVVVSSSLVILLGYHCANATTGSSKPKNRAALLEYRREDGRLAASGSSLA